ncbi:MAG: TetR/AcrR family transcriptional regulator [Acidobacteriia bacterium]|nr:TetR/AcrR family transcriptional regulator [Terriglobia bacterium]
MATDSPTSALSSRPKGDKRDRTRAKLLEAARALIRERGYERTTLEDVAERAGMTTGAIYGNFKNRDDLFIALGQTYWAPIRPRVKLGSSFPEILHAMAEATIAAIPDRSAAAVGRLTGLAYAITDETMRAQVTGATAESYALGEAWLRAVTNEEDLPMPAAHLVRVLHALTEGLVLQRLLTPSLLPDQVIREAFAALARKPPRA